MIEAEYSYILNNINLDKVTFPDEIKNTYQEIISTISRLRPDEGEQKTKEFSEEQFFNSWNYEVLEAILYNAQSGNEKSTPTLMNCSKNPHFRYLFDAFFSVPYSPSSRNSKSEEGRSIVLELIEEWHRVIKLYFYNHILPQQPDAYLMGINDTSILLRNYYIQNQELCLKSFNEMQNTEKRIVQVPIFWWLYVFSADRAGNRELAEMCINKFLECYKSILKKDIFLEAGYIRKLECLIWKNPEFKDTNINQEILTTVETACKYIDDNNVIYKIYVSAILDKLGRHEKAQEILLGINPDKVKRKDKVEDGFYKLAMYDLEHGNNIYDRMIHLTKVWVGSVTTTKDLEKLTDVKIPDILFRLGRIYIYHDNPEDIEKGIACVEEAHQLGCDEATSFLADMYTGNFPRLKSKIPKDVKKGFEYYQKLAEKGDKNAIAEIGKLYYEGKVIPKDFNKAREYFEKAGFYGEYWLGVMYTRGDGVPQDYQKAHNYFLNAVRDYYYNPYKREAYIALGDLYFTGKIDVVNYIKAMEYYQRAGQSPEAQVRMAYIYENGYEIQKSYTKAKECYEEAGKYGHLEALLRLGDYYLYGLAGKKDYVLSYAYYTLVIRLAKEDSDHPNAQELAQQAEQAQKKLLPCIWNLWSGLTPEEIKEAEDLANTWKYGTILVRNEK